jgi:hypothetical protein
VTDLNEHECEMLDAMLEAFGIPDSLSRKQLMTLFDEDEASAFAMVQVLVREELVAEVGNHGDFDLPEMLVLKPNGEKFLKAGGFLRRYRLELEKPVPVNSVRSKLQQQVLKLQDEKLVHQKKIARLQRMRYLWWALILAALLIGWFAGRVLYAA